MNSSAGIRSHKHNIKHINGILTVRNAGSRPASVGTEPSTRRRMPHVHPKLSETIRHWCGFLVQSWEYYGIGRGQG